MPWSGRSPKLLVKPMNGEGYMSCTAGTQKPPCSAASHNLLKTVPQPASMEWFEAQKKKG